VVRDDIRAPFSRENSLHHVYESLTGASLRRHWPMFRDNHISYRADHPACEAVNHSRPSLLAHPDKHKLRQGAEACALSRASARDLQHRRNNARTRLCGVLTI